MTGDVMFVTLKLTQNDIKLLPLIYYFMEIELKLLLNKFCFLKLSEIKQLKSFIRIGRNFKAKMALNNKKLHAKTYIHKSAIKIFIIRSQHSLSFFSIKSYAPKT